ncbi:DHA2 family efflux MFS transporter permease subunit [Streptomyces sp. NPDC032472]|uniref:DHA2 family efflux MFS transporter permease subunit n=1 Tax=Streptomyces sp. NPDC032472 TaxID=3155018 RepID=UPI0033C61C64
MTLIDDRVGALPAGAAPAARRGAALALLVASHFLLNLDSAIVEVALPSIKNDLGIALADLSWVANAYILAFGGFLLLGGRLGDLFGRRSVFIGGLAVFAAASLAGGLASSPALLVAARAAQGLAAAVISPTALALLMAVYPDRTAAERTERNKALATLGAVAATGGSAGYFLGGVLTDAFGWQSTFLVNVPVAAAAALAAPRLLPRGARPGARGRFDVLSALLVGAGMTLLVYVLLGAPAAGWLSVRTVGLGVVAAVALVLFLLRQRTSSDPLLPLRIFRHRALRGANVIAALVNMAIGPVIFFLSLYTQQVLGYSALAAGLAILPVILTVTVSSTLAGRLLRQLSQRAVMAAGLSLFAAGLLWMGFISGGAYWTELLLPECLVGLGGGLVFVTFTVSGTSGLDEADSGSASGVLTTAQKVGASLGLAVLTALADARTRAAAGGGAQEAGALLAGYQSAIWAAAVPVVLGLVAAAVWLPGRGGHGGAVRGRREAAGLRTQEPCRSIPE